MSSPPLPGATERLTVLHRLLPGSDFGVGSVARLLDEDLATAVEAIADLVEVGVLESCGQPSGGDVPADSATAAGLRYKPTGQPSPPFVLPVDDGEKDATYRVLRHLLVHSTAVAATIAPREFRFADLGALPVFANEAAAVAWFSAEWEAVFAAQQTAYALRDLPMTWQFAEAVYPVLHLLRRHDDQVAVQNLGASAAAQLNHPAAGTLHARLGAACNALGRHDHAVRAGERARFFAERHGHAQARCAAHLVLGAAHRGLRQHERAFAQFHTAWDIALGAAFTTPTGHRYTPHPSIGLVACEIALTHLEAGDPAAALAPAQQAVEHLARDPGRRRDLAWALVVFGCVLTATGEAAAAIVVLNDALTALDADVDLYDTARVKEALAYAADAHGDHRQALRDRQDAIRLYELAGHHDVAQQLGDLPAGQSANRFTDTPSRTP